MSLRSPSASVASLLALSLQACTPPIAAVYGLKPEYPEARGRGVYTAVDSTLPMLRWEPLAPREGTKWVVYDLRLYRAENDSPGKLIVEENALPLPRFQFQKGLETCAKYFWTVRARFRVSGREEATEWGVVQSPDRDRWVPVVPDPGYYRFETPCR